MIACDICIIGAGVMGASAACEVARCGATVALIDQAALPNPRAASVDHSKVFRFSYPDPLYVRMAVEALRLWRALEEETGSHLLTETGLVLIGHDQPSFETRCHDALRSLDLEAEMLNADETARRFPQFDKTAFAFSVFDPSGAILHAEKSLRAMIDAARRLGAGVIENERVIEIREGEVITDRGTRVACGKTLVASGPWTRRLLPKLADKLFTTRQEVFYFEPRTGDYQIGVFPVFIELGSGFYGFPVHHLGAMKIANHNKGELIDTDLIDETISEKSIEHCRAFFAEFIPGLASARLRETRVCIYNNTPDDGFIIDWHRDLRNVLIATGFSGHGFKFAPLVGRIAADLLTQGKNFLPVRPILTCSIRGEKEMKILSDGAAVIHRAEFTATEGSRRYRTPISASMGARDIAQTVSLYSPGLAPSRRNRASEETLYVLRGSGRCNINGRRYDLRPGTAVYIPPAAAYQIENTSEEEMEIVSVCCPEEENAETDVTILERQIKDAPRLTLHESERESIPVSDRTFKYLVNTDVGCKRITQFLGVIPPGRAPVHYHTYEEAIYIIEGEGRVHTQGESADFSAGSSIYLPRGVRHSLENTSATPIKLLGVFHPSGSPAVAYEDEEVKR